MHHSMYCQTIIITAFAFLKRPSEDNKEDTEDSARRARGCCVSAALEIADLMSIYRSAWGLERVSTGIIQWVTVTIFTLLEELDTPRNRDAFIELCVVLRAISRRWILAKEMLRLIQLTARNAQISMPEETEALFADFETQAWESKDRDRFSSLYPNFFTSVNNNAGKQNDEIELDSFLARWDALNTLHDNQAD